MFKHLQISKTFDRLNITNNEEFTIPESSSLFCSGGGIFKKGIAVGNNKSIIPGSIRFINNILQYRKLNGWYSILGFPYLEGNQEISNNNLIIKNSNGELKETQIYIENRNITDVELIETEYIVPPENKNLMIGNIQWPTQIGLKNHSLRFLNNGILEPSEGPVPIYDTSIDINKLIYFENNNGKITNSNISITNENLSDINTLSCNKIISNQLNINTPPPTNSTSIGVKGDIAWDDGYIYICVSNNNWKRTQLNSW